MPYTLAEGMVFTTPEPLGVTDTLLADFAEVVGPGTTPSGLPVVHQIMAILAREAMRAGAVPADGLVLTAESLRVHRPPRSGDVLGGRLTIESVRRRAGAVSTRVRGEILAATAETIAESLATLTFREDDDEAGR
ncbi:MULTISPECIES: hypothetical protein [unclassified Gordonia (in: high G+C Gram-positive bacteria)]